MRNSVQAIVFLKNFATGITASVLALVLLAHGGNINTLSLMIGVYSFTVIIAEFPSGVFADLHGRKTSFLLSALLFFASYSLLLISQTALLLCCAMIMQGLARAFSSGSIDALAIDQSSDYNRALEWVTARLAILESAGLATGALAGGVLSGLGTRYMGNLGVNAAIYAALFFLGLFFVQEVPREKRTTGQAEGFRAFYAHVKDNCSFLLQKGTIRALFVLSLVTGFALASVETYWQPMLKSFHTPYWSFGAVSFAGFAFVILGNWVSARVLARHSAQSTALLLLLKALFGASLILLYLQSAELPFVALYLVAYLFLGAGSVAESTLLNRLAPASHRAGILSLFSFVLQLGGLIASVCGFLVSTYSRYQNIWLMAGALLLICASIFAILRKKSSQQSYCSEPSISAANGEQ